ncbi:MAG: DNA utilization protein GntX [Microgenomates bacterium OLB23]|nr:MAG: DNA utilization protein GntX [Microgenomates bacterium OLB23]
MGISLLDLLFPKLCFNCRSLGRYICTECKSKLFCTPYDICPYCERESIYGLTHGVCAQLYGIDGMLNIFLYDGALQKIIKAIKFRRIRGGVASLIDVIPGGFWEKLIGFGATFFDDLEVMAVPLHKKRYKERGFNQVDDFAQACAIMLQKKCVYAYCAHALYAAPISTCNKSRAIHKYVQCVCY